MNPMILLGEPSEPHLPLEKLPSSTLFVPEAGNRTLLSKPFQVYVKANVYDGILRHVNENSKLETGGLLVGHPFRNIDNSNITFVVIVGFIPQDTGNRSVGHFTVGPKEIEISRMEMENKYPGLVAVGWYHSHPGHSVFLSGQDMTIVRSLYNASWNLALVIDPINVDSAFFYGPKGIKLNNWITLKDTPAGIKAIAKYNQIVEGIQSQSELLDEFIKWISSTNDPELSHWKIRGQYQNISLIRQERKSYYSTANETSSIYPETQKLTENTEIIITSDEKDILAQEKEDVYLRNIEKEYVRACSYVESNQLTAALDVFTEIEKNMPGYKDVRTKIKTIEYDILSQTSKSLPSRLGYRRDQEKKPESDPFIDKKV